jgi:hypothetical protein
MRAAIRAARFTFRPVRLSSKINIRISEARTETASSIGERTRIRTAGYVPLIRPQVHTRSKLDLEVGNGTAPAVNSDVDAATRIDAIRRSTMHTAPSMWAHRRGVELTHRRRRPERWHRSGWGRRNMPRTLTRVGDRRALTETRR